MNSDEFDALIWAMRRPLQLFGCWPYSTNRLHSLLVFLILLMNIGAGTSEIRLLLASDDVNILIEACLVTSVFNMTVARFVTFSLHREDMRYVIDIMRHDWNSDDEEDARLLASKTKFAFKLSKLFTLNVLLATSAFIFMPGLEACLVISAFNMSVARFLTFSFHREDMRYVIDVMRRGWMNVRADEDARVLASKTAFACKLSKFFTLNVLFTGPLFAIMPALEQLLSHGDDHKAGILPFGGYYYFNHTSSSPVYWATYATNAIFGAIGSSTIAGATSFSLISMMHAAAKFALVRRRFDSITNDEWMQQSSTKFNACVREHQECIKFAETVENVINFLALAQFIISTGLVCFAGFQLTTMLQDRGRLTKYGSFLNAAIFELFMFSYSGQCLKSESEAVADFAYSSNWLGAYRKSIDIQMVIMRASKACTITAAKFYDMCLESFLKVLSSSFSYFSVLIATQDN